jgi:hypothetical protein
LLTLPLPTPKNKKKPTAQKKFTYANCTHLPLPASFIRRSEPLHRQSQKSAITHRTYLRLVSKKNSFVLERQGFVTRIFFNIKFSFKFCNDKIVIYFS